MRGPMPFMAVRLVNKGYKMGGRMISGVTGDYIIEIWQNLGNFQ
jgi:hypothetical protein